MRKVIYLSDFRRGRVTMRKSNDEIEKIVNNICKMYNVDISDVDPVKLAVDMGITVQLVEFKDSDISGALSKDGDSYTISVNKHDTYARKRFTIAHEIGHYVLEHLGDNAYEMEVFRKNGQSNDKEIEANKFAAALLVNEEHLKDVLNIVKRISDNDDKIKILANYFEVSKQTIRFRLKSIGVI